MRRHWPLFVFICFVVCQPAFAQTDSWRDQFDRQLPALGHRNWVVIADSAYPAQTSPGIQVILADSPHLKVVEVVLRELQNSKHVKPVIYLDKELPYVEERFARGIGRFRESLTEELSDFQVTPMLHEELLEKLGKAGDSYKIVVLKTDLTLPYTSVFIELDAGYWSPTAESSMRRKMQE